MRNDPGVVLSIQYLRAAAAMAVAVSHIAGHPGLSLETGAAGVDVFFVISGFIIWTVTSRRPTTPGRFLLDRLTRLAPPYVALTLAIYLIATRVPGAFPNMRVTWPHAVESMLFIPHTDPSGTMFPLVVPGWTLNYEMFFYAIFAAALLAPPLPRLWITTGTLVVLPLIGAVTDRSYAGVFTYTNPQLLEFVAGLWLGVAWDRDRLPSARWGFAVLCAALVALTAWQFAEGFQPQTARALVWGVPAALIVGGALAIERRSGVLRAPVALLLGNASYSIYLVNVFVVAAVWRLVGRFSVPGYCAAAIVASAAGGLAFWWCVERPLTRFVRARARRPAPMESAA